MDDLPRGTIWEFEVLRALAIIFVMLSHVATIFVVPTPANGHTSANFYLSIFKAVSIPIGEVGNCLFFFISGYLLYFNDHRMNDLAGFYRRRIVRVYPQYLLILLLFFHSSKDLFIYAAGLQGVLNLSDQGFWFIGAIVFYYLLYPLITYPKRKDHLLITASILLFGMSVLHNSLNLFFIGDILYYGVFVAGIVSAIEVHHIDIFYNYFKDYTAPIYILLLLFAAFAAALRYWKLTYVLASPVVMSVLFMFISITGSIVAYFSIRSYGHLLMKTRAMVTVIAYSAYSIYLIHDTIFSKMSSLLMGIHASGLLYDFLIITAILISFSIILPVGYCIQRLQDLMLSY
jgi:peptidoglycan/LPS O-acetylase OafA/YrhL